MYRIHRQSERERERARSRLKEGERDRKGEKGREGLSWQPAQTDRERENGVSGRFMDHWRVCVPVCE